MDWAIPEHSKNRVDKAAAVLTNPKAWAEAWDVEDALEIINNFRSAHSFPLLVFRLDLARRSRRLDTTAIVGQRIKRLVSIEAKLKRFPTMRLTHMQDIGGCRAVLRNVSLVRRLAVLYRNSAAKHTLVKAVDYIKKPKSSGYRGIHLRYAYCSDGDDKKIYNGLKIEIQLRTRLQHAWATAVETVDAFTGQALKGGRGEEVWARFFALIATHIAKRERKPLVPDTPTDMTELRGEIVHLVNDLEVITHLQSYRTTLQIKPNEIPGANYYLVELNAADWKVNITGYRDKDLGDAERDYTDAEKRVAGQRGLDAVLVSVNSLSALKRAYPNYFADTHVFIQTVKEAVGPGAPVR